MVTEIPDGFQMPDGLFWLFFEAELDDFVEVLQRFVQCLPLRITTRKKRAFYHIEAIFVFTGKNWEIYPIRSGHFIQSSECPRKTPHHSPICPTTLAIALAASPFPKTSDRSLSGANVRAARTIAS